MGTWGSGATSWYVRANRQKRGKREERCQETRGGGMSQGGGGLLQGRLCVERMRGRGSVLKGQEAVAAQQQGWHNNQLANKRPVGGEAFADRRGWIIERRENEVAHCRDNRGRWMRRDKRRRDHQPGQTREVNGKRTPRLAVGRQERRWTILLCTKRAVECVFDQICSFGLYVIRYVMFLCFQVHFRTKQTKCFFAHVMLNIICFYVFMFLGMHHLFKCVRDTNT